MYFPSPRNSFGIGTNQVKLCKNDNILTVSSRKSTDISTRKPSAILGAILQPVVDTLQAMGGGLLFDLWYTHNQGRERLTLLSIYLLEDAYNVSR